MGQLLRHLNQMLKFIYVKNNYELKIITTKVKPSKTADFVILRQNADIV